MADKSRVALAYAEVRADLSKLPGDMKQVPNLVKRMLSIEGFKAVRDILTGNVSKGVTAIATRGYEMQAQKLEKMAKAALDAKKNIESWAKVAEARAGDKSLSPTERAKYAAQATRLSVQAARKGAAAERMAEGAASARTAGMALGAEVSAAAGVAVAAVAAVAASAVAYMATTVAAAQRATENLKTAQLVRATGEAAGWTSQQLDHMAENLRKVSNFSKTDISSAQQTLLNHPNVKGTQFQKSLVSSANIAAINGKGITEVASELADALSSPAEKAVPFLEKYGVLLNGAQQGQIKNAMAARDFAKAQDLVLGYLTRFDGAAKEASETGSGGFEKLKNTLLTVVEKIGSLYFDIGRVAGKTAEMIDTFMEFQVVKDILDLATLEWRILSGVVSDFIDSNKQDVTTWANYVSEIYHNIRDVVLQVWDWIKKKVSDVWRFLIGLTGSTWQDIKDTITDVLDVISLYTTSFELTANYVWKSIQLTATETWDKIRDGLANVAASFEAMWGAIAAGATAAWDKIEGAFTGKKSQGIGEAMAKGFSEGLVSGTSRYKMGDSELTKRLKQEVEDLKKQMEDARKAKREQREKERQPKKEERKKKGNDYINTKPFKFEFSGFTELSKKIQSSLYPNEALEMQRAGLDAAQKAVANGEQANKLLGNIAEGVKGGAKFSK